VHAEACAMTSPGPTNRLEIRKEYYPEVTQRPHFVVTLLYEGCVLSFEDIYFDFCDDLAGRLEQLESSRQGKVRLDGGFRFSMEVEVLPRGAIQLSFQVESDATFPGNLKLQGYFHKGGEYAAEVLNALIRLFRDGDEFIL